MRLAPPFFRLGWQGRISLFLPTNSSSGPICLAVAKAKAARPRHLFGGRIGRLAGKALPSLSAATLNPACARENRLQLHQEANLPLS
jgi:hypothetical protein